MSMSVIMCMCQWLYYNTINKLNRIEHKSTRAGTVGSPGSSACRWYPAAAWCVSPTAPTTHNTPVAHNTQPLL